jgi:hypothetical protein
MRVTFHIVIICLEERSEVSRFYCFMLLALFVLYSEDMTILSRPTNVATVHNEAANTMVRR